MVANCLNITGNAVLIWVFHMGVAGAALATLGSRVFSAIVVLWLLRSPKNEIAVKDYLTIRPDGTQIGMILKIRRGYVPVRKLAIQPTASPWELSPAQVNMENLNGVAAIGIGIGLMTVVGECMGAGRKDEAVYYVKTIVIIIICCGAIFLLTKPITTLGGMEPESASLCFHMITWITIVKPIVWTAAFIPAYGLRAAGDVKFSMIISCLTMWLCPGEPLHFPEPDFGMAVWIGMFSDWTLRGIFFGIRFHSRKWLEKKKSFSKGTPMKKKVTTTDIARMAGVSQATVSMILNKNTMSLFPGRPLKRWKKPRKSWATTSLSAGEQGNLRVRSSSLSFARLSRIPTM